jgi:alpha-galactosidase
MVQLAGKEAPSGAFWVDSVDLRHVEQDWGHAAAGRSVENHPITLGGHTFVHGIGTHANSDLSIALHGEAELFTAMVGVDDETGTKGSVRFEVWVDGKKVADSGLMRGKQVPKLFSADLHAAKTLRLAVTDGDDGIDFDHADWAGAIIVMAAGSHEKPSSITIPDFKPEIIVAARPEPAIHGARIVGATPGRPFQYLVAATGERPLEFSAEGLPAGLSIDTATGLITGSLKKAGTTEVTVRSKNSHGAIERKLTIVGGQHKLALTPPLGWNSWNCWASAVSDEKVRASADAMVSSGLAAHGFQYINIDDCWEAGRDANGNIQSNEKFPDMKALADYVHSRGLKLGIYSSPGPKTCAGYTASYQHEQKDADTYARWGVDYLKYDWCSYDAVAKNKSLPELMKPYRVMHEALDRSHRDIVFSLCQYGMGDVWKWGEEVGGNCWRTTGDINDSWSSLAEIGFSQNGHEKYAGPGHWNDPDMLVVGKVGWGPSLHPTHLKPQEQVLHISLWCLLSSPLLIGCDMTQMDDFTLALLTNDEVLDINQDPVGKPAGRVSQDGNTEVWARPLYDGTHAVGLFNRGREKATVKVHWSDLKIPSGPQPVRDLWKHKDLGNATDGTELAVPPHGAVLLKIGVPDIGR